MIHEVVDVVRIGSAAAGVWRLTLVDISVAISTGSARDGSSSAAGGARTALGGICSASGNAGDDGFIVGGAPVALIGEAAFGDAWDG